MISISIKTKFMEKVLNYLKRNKPPLENLLITKEQNMITIRGYFKPNKLNNLIKFCSNLVNKNKVSELLSFYNYNKNQENTRFIIFYGKDKNLRLGINNLKVYKKQIIKNKPFVAYLIKNKIIVNKTKEKDNYILLINYKEKHTNKFKQLFSSVFVYRDFTELSLFGDHPIAKIIKIIGTDLDSCIKKLINELDKLGLELQNTEIIRYKTKKIKGYIVNYIPIKNEIICSIPFLKKEIDKLKKEYKCKQMEERWNILSSRNSVYLIRSWTSNLIYELLFKEEHKDYILRKIIVYCSLPNKNNPKKTIDFIIKFIKNFGKKSKKK